MLKIKHSQENSFLATWLPLSLTFIVFAVLSIFIYFQIHFLNQFTLTDIVPKIRLSDVVIGLTIYLKTSVDFAIFIGNLMASYPGWRNRIAIEIGTALGNALGTIIILTIWDFFREVEWLLAIMIFIAALVLFKLAEEGLEHTQEKINTLPRILQLLTIKLEVILSKINRATGIFMKYLIPNISMKANKNLTWIGLFLVAFTIPFILGLDDFAGYVPVFNLVNVFGFSIGVLAGHLILNVCLFVSPSRTIKVVKNPIVSLFGSIAFVGLGIWGLWEVAKIFIIR